jgi:oligoribonuclease NrnB/cAMP/cGMP phosphodiesterase (DHH superfamily)
MDIDCDVVVYSGGSLKPIVLYHYPCQDGFTAAWAVWKFNPEWEFYPAKHGDPPPDVTGRDVYMVDFSYKRPVILEMASKAKSIVIIDHHKTAEADLNPEELPSNVFVHFDKEHSGAYLTWQFFHPEQPVPELVLTVEDRDLWRFARKHTKELSEYFFACDYDFHVWDSLYMIMKENGEGVRRNYNTDSYKYMYEGGQCIMDRKYKDTKELCQNKFYGDIGGFIVPIVNLPYTFSSDAGHLLSQYEPFAATYFFDGKDFVFSLRSAENGVDVSQIAKGYGGGGHAHAAGFKVSPSQTYRGRDGLLGFSTFTMKTPEEENAVQL